MDETACSFGNLQASLPLSHTEIRLADSLFEATFVIKVYLVGTDVIGGQSWTSGGKSTAGAH